MSWSSLVSMLRPERRFQCHDAADGVTGCPRRPLTDLASIIWGGRGPQTLGVPPGVAAAPPRSTPRSEADTPIG
jgi:hypothetical protein